eukprot:CAMPEP_0174730730 /NCGR_PEP_ID=MMETSP1094-20130205/56187_1 /TAXON_ID=156173 /ORGANISM="Chrysochromulina brevifilum, Strain UTEX LB 985" /LENGTH=88 /DNA_ID=CAMNT_0015933021 /DNA_START=205 /DNA_END=471 /DNA_ORIENTATION=+
MHIGSGAGVSSVLAVRHSALVALIGLHFQWESEAGQRGDGGSGAGSCREVGTRLPPSLGAKVSLLQEGRHVDGDAEELCTGALVIVRV